MAIRLHIVASAVGFSKTTIWYKTVKGAASAARFWMGESPIVEKDPTGREVITGTSHLGRTSMWIEGATAAEIFPKGIKS